MQSYLCVTLTAQSITEGSKLYLNSISFPCIFWISPFFPLRENRKKKPITPEGRRLLGLCGTRITRWLTHNGRGHERSPVDPNFSRTDGWLNCLLLLVYDLWLRYLLASEEENEFCFLTLCTCTLWHNFRDWCWGCLRGQKECSWIVHYSWESNIANCVKTRPTLRSPCNLTRGYFRDLQTTGKSDNWSCKYRHHNSHFKSYRSGTVNSKSFVGKVLLRIKWKFKLN